MHDLITGLDRTTRVVVDGDLGGDAAHVVELRRHVSAPIADVWDACTDPERVGRWFVALSGDLRAGGRFQLEGNAGGEIVVCEPPRRLEVTWQFGEMEPSRVSLALTADGEGTELMLRHTVPDDDHWAQYGPGAVGVGWEGAVAGLVTFLAAAERPDDPELLADFMRRSAAAWGEAHEAAGAAPETARDAAVRTSSFYAPAA